MPKPANPIPPGFHSVTVHLHIEGAAKYIDFLKHAFGAVEIDRSPGPGGKLMHATVRVGDSVVMFADDFSMEMGKPPFVRTNPPFLLHLYVSDADIVWDQALASGCEVVFPISDQFWGDRYGQVRDPFGVIWAIASRKEELTREEIAERQAKMFGGGH